MGCFEITTLLVKIRIPVYKNMLGMAEYVNLKHWIQYADLQISNVYFKSDAE